MLTVCFAGLPSAGKSTTINALAGKRVLESGVCRTTTEVCLVGKANTVGAPKWVPTKLESDDGVEFCAVDLPGVCDAEDASGSFDGVTREWAAKCDVVVWVTDARSAFLTTHETSEYAALRAAIQEKADEDGTLYQFCIVIAKYDAGNNTTGTINTGIRFLDGEIRTSAEETTIEACFARVERMFPDARIVKFSAFARIVKSGSEALRALVSAHTSGANGTFDLKWATENMVEKRFAQMTRVLRNTRREVTRLRKVDETLAVLMSRVAPSPVYDTPVELEVVTQDPRTGQLGGPLYSFTIAMDAAVTVKSGTDAFSGYTNVRMGPMGYVEMCVSYNSLNDVTQVIAPTVRPVYGDVIAVPAHFYQFHCSGASGANTKLVIYAGADVGEKYALKVGEVNRDQVSGLHAALQGKSGCLVRRKGP
jgi:GTPase Era involved in 16S rRNA processing